EYEQTGPLVYITIAGRSNALSAVVDANTRYPVIACPPYSDRFSGMDILSSLRLPSGIASPTILEPEGAALLAAKMLALSDPQLAQRLDNYRQRLTTELEQADEEVRQL
ncbi:MAG TPA: AIR carboxylase family protein, partial [Ktedonobacteraceae bacterium]|nr:AIR carboxylase family protein [Ktedonobacteraceae bacterium]